MISLQVLSPIALPMMFAALMALPAVRPLVWRMIPLAPLPALALVLLVPVPVTLRVDWLILGSYFGIDPISRLFLGFTAVLWIAAGAAARHWFSNDARAGSFAICFLLAMTGNFGLILAQDAFSFYACFALMSFASYGLVVHARSPAAFGSGRLYISFVIAGELALFAGLALAVAEAGSPLLAVMRVSELPDLAAALLIAGFAVKLGVMPLHFWLPLAHGAAPVPASAVLSGAMIKAGLYGMLATLPLGAQALPDHGTVLLAAGLVTVFAAVILGLGQTSPKAVLGFSSVSQMGIIALGLGAGLLSPGAWPALLPVLVFLAAHHALAKGALFLGVGLFGTRKGTGGRALVLTMLAAPALVLAGLPATSGALGKDALKTAFAAGSAEWLPWLTVALTLSGVATTLLMARFAVTLWRNGSHAPAAAAPDGLALATLGLLAASIVLPVVWPAVAGDLAAPIRLATTSDPLPLAIGAIVALGALVRAHALAIGPSAFMRQLARPFVVAVDWAGGLAERQRRVLRRTSRQVPATLAEHGARWRLGQTAIAGLIALVFLVESLAPRPGADVSPGSASDTRPDPVQFDDPDPNSLAGLGYAAPGR